MPSGRPSPSPAKPCPGDWRHGKNLAFCSRSEALMKGGANPAGDLSGSDTHVARETLRLSKRPLTPHEGDRAATAAPVHGKGVTHGVGISAPPDARERVVA